MNWNRPYCTRTWLLLREKHLKKFPYCNICNTTLQLQVDHIIEHKNNYDLFINENNLQTLCIKCHGLKSANFKTLAQLNKKDYKIEIISDKNGIKINNQFGFFESVQNFKFLNDTFFFYFDGLNNLDSNKISLLCSFFELFFLTNKFISFNFSYEFLNNYFKSRLG